MSKIQKAIDALDGCDEYSLRHHISEVSILIEGYAEAKSELAALREELAELGERYAKMQTGEDKMLHRVIAERDAAEQRNADGQRDAERYRKLRKITPYRFKKMQEASVTDGGDVLYFHADRFDALMDAELTKPTESGASE